MSRYSKAICLSFMMSPFCMDGLLYAQVASLKGGIHLIEGIDEYRLEVKFNSDWVKYSYGLNYRNSFPDSNFNRYKEKLDSIGLEFEPIISDELIENSQAKNLRVLDKDLDSMSNKRLSLMQANVDNYTKEELLKLANYLESLPIVEFADLVPKVMPPPPSVLVANDQQGTFITPDLSSFQSYLNSDPGINAAYAWSLSVFGEEIRVADIEYDWDELHEDIPSSFSDEFLPVCSCDFDGIGREHGTAVLGIISGVRNVFGITGGADQAEYRGYGETSGRATAIYAASDWLRAGDVMLLEMQQPMFGETDYGPADFTKSVWDAVMHATNKGIHVVAAAGNGGQSLDSPADYLIDYLNRGDNGSIIVGAGTSTLDHFAFLYSTYGSRVNLQGWGRNVFTTGFGSYEEYDDDEHRRYTHEFAGTSSATPMVAMSVILVQSWAKRELGIVITPRDMRQLLINTGIEQGIEYPEFPGLDGQIGPLPNIEAAINGLIDYPLVVTNEPLLVARGDTSEITTTQLSAIDNSATVDDLVYSITHQPTSGYLEQKNQPGVVISSFTQQDITEANIIYIHDGSDKIFDTLIFSISDGSNQFTGQVFNIQITSVDDGDPPLGDGPPSIVINKPLLLLEGGSEKITTSVLDITDKEATLNHISFQITDPLSKGYVAYSSSPDLSISSWTAQDIADNKVIYQHDGSDSTEDEMVFSVSDGTNTLPDINFKITITLIDDAPVLARNEIALLNDENSILITRDLLEASDEDTPAEEIIFLVVVPALFGHLENINAPGIMINQFSQADIANGRVMFFRTDAFQEYDTFTFKITDGSSESGDFLFAIEGNVTSNLITVEPTQLQLYPNPAGNVLFVRGDRIIDEIIISDLSGRSLIKRRANTKELTINTQDLPKAIYFVTFKVKQEVITKQIIKN